MSMATLKKQRDYEGLGLSLAIVAHLALFAGLLWQANREPPIVPPAERMVVSLATDVSLESTAPDPADAAQAAIAPELAPQPIPARVTEPPPKPVERTSIRPVAKPSQAAKPPIAKPTPRPRQTPAGGSRLGDDFLAGTSDGDRARAGTPAVTFGPAERAALEQSINRQLKVPWQRAAPSGVDVEKLVTVLTWELNQDGSLKGRPRLVSQSGVTDSNRPQAALHVERAIRAVQLAAPFDLPPEYYDKWRRIRDWSFDWKLSS